MLKKLVPAAALATLAFAAPAAAQTVAIAPSPDPVEDVPFLVTATGIGIEDYNVYATIKPVGAVGCGPTYETDADGESFMYGEDAEGAYSAADSAKVANPGPYLVCAWMQEYAGDSVAVAATSATVNVRSARATLAITGPTQLRIGSTANFTFTGTTEIDRDVYATVKRDGGRPCGSSSSVDDGDSFVWEDAQGNFSVLDSPWTYQIERHRARGGRDLHVHRRHPGALFDRPQPRLQRPPQRAFGEALRHPRQAALRAPRAFPRAARRPPRVLIARGSVR
jgi:hypothetical protein